jgi:hypothetical protein
MVFCSAYVVLFVLIASDFMLMNRRKSTTNAAHDLAREEGISEAPTLHSPWEGIRLRPELLESTTTTTSTKRGLVSYEVYPICLFYLLLLQDLCA